MVPPLKNASFFFCGHLFLHPEQKHDEIVLLISVFLCYYFFFLSIPKFNSNIFGGETNIISSQLFLEFKVSNRDAAL